MLYKKTENYTLFQGSNLDVLPTLPDNSIDAIVTDPPYEIGFLGRSWDSSGIAFSVELWAECLRVLKPGGYVLAFGASRTFHRVAVAIEDAGFELRDSIAWLYGSGFPKGLNVSKGIDKAAGAEREVIGMKTAGIGTGNDFAMRQADGNNKAANKFVPITAPATEDAKKWDGWNTAIKPAFEPIVVGRKPLEGTVVANVLKYGTGPYNVNATRIPVSGVELGKLEDESIPLDLGDGVVSEEKRAELVRELETLGRYPTNVIFDESQARVLDEQTGDLEASRFFYVAKPDRKDRHEGLDASANVHPTVKPTDLLRYLLRLVCAPGGTVLDVFNGSGSTGKAALLDGYKYVGIELTEDYLPITEARLDHIESKRAKEAVERLF